MTAMTPDQIFVGLFLGVAASLVIVLLCLVYLVVRGVELHRARHRRPAPRTLHDQELLDMFADWDGIPYR